MAEKIRTTCFDCHSKCGVILTVEGNDIIKVEGDPNHPVSEGILCTKAYSAQEIHTHPDRLTHPLRRTGERGEGKWERITWDEALDEIAGKAKELMEKYGPQSVAFTVGTGRGSNHFMTRLINTMNATFVGPGNVCLAPFLMQTQATWGRQFHPHEAGDYRNAGCIVMWGTNPIRSRQYTGLRILDGKRNGAHIVVVDPVYRDISARADLWVPVRPGTDAAIALCMTNLIFKNEYWKKNPDFLRNWTNGPFLVDEGDVYLLRRNRLADAGDAVDDGGIKVASTGGMSGAAVSTSAQFVVWDEAAGKPAYWDPTTESWDREGVVPALFGEYELELADGTKQVFHTALEQYKRQLEPWTPEAISPITWTPVDALYRMYDLITDDPDGKATLVAPYLGSCMMTTNALQTGRALTILQLLLEPPIDEPGGIFFNTFWEFMSDPRITRPDLRPEPMHYLGEDRYPLFCKVGNAGSNPGEFWAAAARGDDNAPRMYISMASDALGSQEQTKNVYAGLTNPRTEMIVSMDYFMNPEGELADIVLPAAHWSERVGNFDEELYPEPCPFVVPQIAVQAPGEAKDDWYFLREMGKRFNPEAWPWESSEEMQLWRLSEFHMKAVGKEPVTDYEEAAKQGYYVEFGAENRKFRKYETGEVKFATGTKKVEIFSEMMLMFGYDWPLPTFNEPYEGPVNQPELYKTYDLVMTTGARDYAFYHSAWTNIAHQRVLEPWPYVELNDEDAEARGIGEGDWLWVESLRGRIKAKARVHQGVTKGCASMCRQNYKHACEELGLPGFSWDGANPNVLVDGLNGNDPGWGSAPMRGFLTRVYKVEDEAENARYLAQQQAAADAAYAITPAPAAKAALSVN